MRNRLRLFPGTMRGVAHRIIDELRSSVNEWFGLHILIHRVEKDSRSCAHYRLAPVVIRKSENGIWYIVIRKQVIPDKRLPFE